MAPLFLNKKCFICSSHKACFAGVCLSCLSNLQGVEESWSIEVIQGFSIWKLNHVSHQFLRCCKYMGYENGFQFQLQRELERFHQKKLSDVKIIWIPIPLHWIRMKERGFNQAKIVANELQRIYGGEVWDCLSRPKENISLTQMNLKRRKEETKNRIFQFNPLGKSLISMNLASTRIFIVDDMVTTGATLLAAYQVVKNLDVLSIDFFTAIQGFQLLRSDFQKEMGV